ncbi:MAG: FtsH protease activity modulator HflK [Gammaproteobacteria bacterium]
MSWNEPPDGRDDKQGDKKGRDPWDRNNEGPPDLDEIVKKMQDGFGGLFGKRSTSRGGSGRSGGSGANTSALWLLAILALAVLGAYNMTHQIDQQERGIVKRFGRYNTTLQPGLRFTLPAPIDEVVRVNVGKVRDIEHRASMLTQDENIVDVKVAVQWRINDPFNYLFNVKDPNGTLRQATESAVRSVIGKSELDFVLTEGRSEIASRQRELIQKIMNEDYAAGILIVTVAMQSAKPPDAVKAAFNDAIKAREDEQRLVNEAEAYYNDIIPRARGNAARVLEEANGYKESVIAHAEGDASRFEQLLTEYKRAPAITRKRLYLEAMESVLANTGKVLIDTDAGNSLMYLPIDKLLQNRGGGATGMPRQMDGGTATRNPQDQPERNSNRTREAR